MDKNELSLPGSVEGLTLEEQLELLQKNNEILKNQINK